MIETEKDEKRNKKQNLFISVGISVKLFDDQEIETCNVLDGIHVENFGNGGMLELHLT